MVAGRNASGIASELGSMKVTEQIDAMRALGTDPIQKLVTPRLIATCVMLPLLTIIADFVGMFGGFVIAYFIAATSLRRSTGRTAYQILECNDVVQGLLKPFIFAIVISLVGCFYGMRTTRRHAGRRPRHHAGGGRRLGLDLHPHLHSSLASS